MMRRSNFGLRIALRRLHAETSHNRQQHERDRALKKLATELHTKHPAQGSAK